MVMASPTVYVDLGREIAADNAGCGDVIVTWVVSVDVPPCPDTGRLTG